MARNIGTHCHAVASALLLVVYSPTITAQEPQDWRTTYPVSLNGRTSLLIRGVETELIPPERSSKYWHSRFQIPYGYSKNLGWKASDFFDDPLVIKLFEATEARDLERMEQLIKQGADVNAIGKENLTLLYLAFHINNDPRPFDLLLRHGADPNVICYMKPTNENDYSVLAMQGNAVVHLVCRGYYNRLFKAVFDHGGNPNLPCFDPLFNTDPPWHFFGLGPDAEERLKVIIDSGAYLDSVDSEGKTFAQKRLAYPRDRTCRLLLILFKHGANWRRSYTVDGHPWRAIHFLAKYTEKAHELRHEQGEDFDRLVDWLESKGEDLENAKEDLKKWRSKDLRGRREGRQENGSRASS